MDGIKDVMISTAQRAAGKCQSRSPHFSIISYRDFRLSPTTASFKIARNAYSYQRADNHSPIRCNRRAAAESLQRAQTESTRKRPS